jgi:hypothetical protein
MWTDKPIQRIVGIAPEGLNGCVLFFEDKTAYGLTPQQRELLDPKPGDLFTLTDFGSIFIRKPEDKNAT